MQLLHTRGPHLTLMPIPYYLFPTSLLDLSLESEPWSRSTYTQNLKRIICIIS